MVEQKSSQWRLFLLYASSTCELLQFYCVKPLLAGLQKERGRSLSSFYLQREPAQEPIRTAGSIVSHRQQVSEESLQIPKTATSLRVLGLLFYILYGSFIARFEFGTLKGTQRALNARPLDIKLTERRESN